MKNGIISVLVLIVILLVGFLVWPTSPSQDLPEASVTKLTDSGDAEGIEDGVMAKEVGDLELTITGFGPGKVHPGTFDDITISDLAVSESGIPVSGTLTIKSESRSFGIDGLNTHLCAPEFLNCENNPLIIFSLTEMTQNSNTEFTANGVLTFKDTISSISFPVTKSGEDFSGDFRLNVKDLGVSYIGIDSEIQIQFAGSLK